MCLILIRYNEEGKLFVLPWNCYSTKQGYTGTQKLLIKLYLILLKAESAK